MNPYSLLITLSVIVTISGCFPKVLSTGNEELAVTVSKSERIYFRCVFKERRKGGVRFSDLIEGDLHYDTLLMVVSQPRELETKEITIILQGGSNTISTKDKESGSPCSFYVAYDDLGSSFPRHVWESDLVSFRWLSEETSANRVPVTDSESQPRVQDHRAPPRPPTRSGKRPAPTVKKLAGPVMVPYSFTCKPDILSGQLHCSALNNLLCPLTQPTKF